MTRYLKLHRYACQYKLVPSSLFEIVFQWSFSFSRHIEKAVPFNKTVYGPLNTPKPIILFLSSFAVNNTFFLFQQFGVSLKFINQNSPCLNYIPPIIRKCVDSLSITGVIDTEGIFRRSGNFAKVVELKQKVNGGNDVDFKDVDTHVIAGLLKTFLRDLEEPLLTYELYDEITSFLGRSNGMVYWSVHDRKILFLSEHPKEERSRNVKQMLREKLPIENYELFKYLIEFLVKVSDPRLNLFANSLIFYSLPSGYGMQRP